MEEKIKAIEFDPTAEIVVSEQSLMDILQGLTDMGVELYCDEDEEKTEEERKKELIARVIILLTFTANLFPRKTRRQIFEAIEEATGVGVTEILP